MGIAQIIKKGFDVAVKSMSVVTVMFIFGFIWNLASLYLTPLQPGAAAAGTTANSVIAVVLAVIFILISIYLQAGTLGFLRDRLKQGNADLANFFAAGGKYYMRLFLMGLMIGALVVLFIVLDTLCFVLLNKSMAVMAVTVVVFLAAIEVYFLILFFLAPYISVASEKNAMDSLKQSLGQLGKGVNPVFGILYLIGFAIVTIAYLILPAFRKSKLGQSNFVKLLVAATVILMIGFLVGLIWGAILAGLSFVIKVLIVQQILFAFFSSLINAFLGVFMTAVFMAYYLGLSNSNPQGAE